MKIAAVAFLFVLRGHRQVEGRYLQLSILCETMRDKIIFVAFDLYFSLQIEVNTKNNIYLFYSQMYLNSFEPVETKKKMFLCIED